MQNNAPTCSHPHPHTPPFLLMYLISYERKTVGKGALVPAKWQGGCSTGQGNAHKLQTFLVSQFKALCFIASYQKTSGGKAAVV